MQINCVSVIVTKPNSGTYLNDDEWSTLKTFWILEMLFVITIGKQKDRHKPQEMSIPGLAVIRLCWMHLIEKNRVVTIMFSSLS